MKKDLVVLVPTRGRPQNAARLSEGWRDTGTQHADLVFVTDWDDPELTAYKTLLEEGVVHSMVTFGPDPGDSAQSGMVRPLNRAAAIYRDAYRYVGFMGDDHMPRTTGWEDRVIEALNDARLPCVAYGNDLFQRENLATAAFMHMRMVKAMGWMAPPTLMHLYVDNFWMELGRAFELTYLEDVIIEHLHPAAGKAALDERYAVVNSPSVDTADRTAWQRYASPEGEFSETMDKIREEYRI